MARGPAQAARLGFLSLLLAACAPGAAAQPIDWGPRALVAEGGGTRGPWRQNESDYDYVDDATLALGSSGEAVVAWVDQARKDVFLRVFRSDEKATSAVNVSRTPATFSWLPRIALSPADPQQVFVLWQEIIFSGGSHGGDILFARSGDGGRTFSPPLNLSDSVAGDGKARIDRDTWHNGSLDLAAGPHGRVYAAWTEYEGALWLARSSDGGRIFEPRMRIGGDDAQPARAPSLALGPQGTVYLAWTVGEDPQANLRLVRSLDEGDTFGEPRIVAPGSGYAEAPKLASSADGTLHLAYGESASGPFGPYHVRYTRSRDGARSFEAPRRISGEGAGFPALGLDGAGNPSVIWELFRDHRIRSRGLGYAISHDAGASFTAPHAVPESAGPPNCWNGSHQGYLMDKLAVSRDGEVAVVNSCLAPRAQSRVWLIRGNAAQAQARFRQER